MLKELPGIKECMQITETSLRWKGHGACNFVCSKGCVCMCVLLLLLLSLYRVVQARATLADLAFIPRLIHF